MSLAFFTNVPLEEVIDICVDALFRNDNIDIELTTLTEDSFKELMRPCYFWCGIFFQ